MKDSAGRVIGFGWSRDKINEELSTTLKNGIAAFKEKHGDVGYVYCSKKDVTDAFVFMGVDVIPVQIVLSGSITIYGKDKE